MLAWLALGAFVLVALAIDFRAGSRRAPSMCAAVGWSIAWTVIGAGFAGVLLVLSGRPAASEYLAGFLVEKSLSLDNLFVFAVLFASLAVPADERRRVLLYGVAGAVVLRGLFILGGAAVLDSLHAATYVLGGLLAFVAVKIARSHGEPVDPERTVPMRLMRRLAPGASTATTALVMVAAFDLMFALDSIPAIFAITRDSFVVFAANAFSLLGMVSLYFVLDGLAERFRHLHFALAAILAWVAAKLLFVDVWHPPVALTLAVIAGALALAALTSTLAGRRERRAPRRPVPRPATAEVE